MRGHFALKDGLDFYRGLLSLSNMRKTPEFQAMN